MYGKYGKRLLVTIFTSTCSRPMLSQAYCVLINHQTDVPQACDWHVIYLPLPLFCRPVTARLLTMVFLKECFVHSPFNAHQHVYLEGYYILCITSYNREKQNSKNKLLDGFFNQSKNVVLQSILVMITISNYCNGSELCMFVVS